MANNLLEHTLTQAFAALHAVSEDEIQQLSLIDCTLTLSVLPDNNALTGLRSRLAGRLWHQLNPRWIHGGDLGEVFLY